MACFLIPAAEAVVATVFAKATEKREQSREEAHELKTMAGAAAATGRAPTDAAAQTGAAQTGGIAPADAAAQTDAASAACGSGHEKPAAKGFARKLSWLTTMLWGGSALLCLEHIWHGEVVPYPPFLTAAPDPAARAEMLHEMSTVGVGMAVLITAVWAGMVIVSGIIEKRASIGSESETASEAGEV